MNEHKNLLFEPRKGVEFTSRERVPLLKVKYTLYRAILAGLVGDWLDGKVGSGIPTETRELEYVQEINSGVNGANGQPLSEDEVSKTVYKEMVNIHVPGHLRIVTSHRRWIRRSHDFLVKIGATFSDKMEDLIWRHDLSKYTHREVLGYAVMFGDGAVNWRQLKEDAEKEEWDNTLHNHYAGNPHHPEYFYPKLPDGSRDKSSSMFTLDPENGKDFVDESIIDMLASRGERILADDAEFDVHKWMAIDEKYLLRYAKEDKAYVEETLDRFRKMAEDFLSNKSNMEAMSGFFDDRAVVFKK